jgi:hypothetical protein
MVKPIRAISSEVLVGSDDHLFEAIAAASPENPFRTAAYVKARRTQGARPLAFFWASGFPGGCIAFIKVGRVQRVLEIPSAPEVDADHPIWETLKEVCRRKRLTRLHVHTFGVSGAFVPALGRQISRMQRREFVLVLDESAPLHLSHNHERNVARARREGVVVSKCVHDILGSAVHSALIGASMARRQARGEDAPPGMRRDTFYSFLEQGAAQLFQASVDRAVVSSMLVLRSSSGAYYHSAGTSPLGMKIGASPLLIVETARMLRDSGVRLFNLGGAGEHEVGLARFKAGFGSEIVESESADFDLARGVRRLVLSIARHK